MHLYTQLSPKSHTQGHTAELHTSHSGTEKEASEQTILHNRMTYILIYEELSKHLRPTILFNFFSFVLFSIYSR